MHFVFIKVSLQENDKEIREIIKVALWIVITLKFGKNVSVACLKCFKYIQLLIIKDMVLQLVKMMQKCKQLSLGVTTLGDFVNST